MSIIFYYGVSNLALPDTAGTGQWSDGDPFTNVQPSHYWSSTTYAGITSSAWRMHMSFGSVSTNTKSGDLYVWQVRGGN